MDIKNTNLHDMLEDKLGIETAIMVVDLLTKISVKDLYDLIERHEFEYNYNGGDVPENHPSILLLHHHETTSNLLEKIKVLEEENAKMKADMQKIKDLHEGIRLITDFMIDMNMKGL